MTPDELAKLSPRDRLAHYKTKAEEAYSAIYEAAPHNQKDLRDDAVLYLHRAIQAAEEAGLSSEKVALEKKAEHVEAVFNQLRTDGGRRGPVTPSKPRLRERVADLAVTALPWLSALVFLVAIALGVRYELTRP